MAEPDTDHHWYALHTRHQHEKAAAGILQRKGFEIFLPLYTAVHRWQDRIKQVSLPLFLCYIFLRGGLHRWLQIMTTPGVSGIVGFGAPAAIPTSEIEDVRRMVETTLRVEPHPFLKSGDWIRVKSGPSRD
jgi:transcription antitermination factor NusG